MNNLLSEGRKLSFQLAILGPSFGSPQETGLRQAFYLQHHRPQPQLRLVRRFPNPGRAGVP